MKCGVRLYVNSVFTSRSYRLRLTPKGDLSHCGISYFSVRSFPRIFTVSSFKDFHVCVRCLLKRKCSFGSSRNLSSSTRRAKSRGRSIEVELLPLSFGQWKDLADNTHISFSFKNTLFVELI